MTDKKPTCIKAKCTEPEAADCPDRACYVPTTDNSGGLKQAQYDTSAHIRPRNDHATGNVVREVQHSGNSGNG